MKKEELLSHLRRIKLVTEKKVEGILPGLHLSRLKGGGIEFEDRRPYQPGSDDPRTIDQKRSIRDGKLSIRKFREEKQLRGTIALDLSPSMLFGSGKFSKLDFAILAAAILGYSALKEGDKIGLLGFSNDIKAYYPSIKNESVLIDCLFEMRDIKADVNERTDISNVLLKLTRRLSAGQVIFLLSDLIEEQNHNLTQSIRRVSSHYDLVPILISDRVERELPRSGKINLRDPESGDVLVIDTSSAAQRDLFSRCIKERKEELARLFSRFGVLWTEISEDRDFVKALVVLFLKKKYLRRF